MWRGVCKKTSVYRLKLWVAGLLVLLLPMVLAGCGVTQTGKEKVQSLDYTVVEDADLPVELKKLIDEKKEKVLKLTYTTKDYTYIVAGYGTQQTSGYSIRVNDVYLGTNAVYADVDLLGPQAKEQVGNYETTPYIVLKIEKKDEPVMFYL